MVPRNAWPRPSTASCSRAPHRGGWSCFARSAWRSRWRQRLRRADDPGVTPMEVAAARPREAGAALKRSPPGGERHPVLAADTVVDVDGRALGKPRDAEEAAAMLGRLSGREHLVHTAFALALPGARRGSRSERRRACASTRSTGRDRRVRRDRRTVRQSRRVRDPGTSGVPGRVDRRRFLHGHGLSARSRSFGRCGGRDSRSRGAN